MICAIAKAARHLGYQSKTQDCLSLCYVLRPCHTQAQCLKLATDILAASAILVLATIVDEWHIDRGIVRTMHNLPGYPTRYVVHEFVDINSRISYTLFPTKTLSHRGSPRSHPRTTQLSVHAYIFPSGMFGTVAVCLSNLAKIKATQNSSRGIVIHFIGATFVLATTKLVCIVPFTSIPRR